MIIASSGRSVKRPGKLIDAHSVVKTHQLIKALGRSKSRTCWGFVLTPSGQAMTGPKRVMTDLAMTELEASRRTEDERRAEQTLKDIRERYTVVRDGNALTFTGESFGDYALLTIETGDWKRPGPRCDHRGTQTHLPRAAFERVAQTWLARGREVQEDANAV